MARADALAFLLPSAPQPRKPDQRVDGVRQQTTQEACAPWVVDQSSTRRPVQIDKDLLAILCCPETKLDVSLADDALIGKVNDAVSRGALKNKAQKPVTEMLDGGLIRADKKILYPIREDIPVMLIEEGIPLDQVL